jgi:hypothetical protein
VRELHELVEDARKSSGAIPAPWSMTATSTPPSSSVQYSTRSASPPELDGVREQVEMICRTRRGS